jgi:hypothetical protein
MKPGARCVVWLFFTTRVHVVGFYTKSNREGLKGFLVKANRAMMLAGRDGAGMRQCLAQPLTSVLSIKYFNLLTFLL